MKHRLALALLASTAIGATPALSEVHAVLVGVGDYPHLDADLQGPPNDARLMAETLSGRGVDPARMVVLTTDPTGLPEGAVTAMPTRAAIMAQLEATAAAAGPGDTVFFYFSGHGSQAPDISGDEGGGYDEIFLPMDASGWKGEIGMVENAILDDELQVWAEGMLSRGVRLVGVIDACHSATGFRALGSEGVARNLDPEALGIPADAPSAPFTGANELSGDFVFLYSSQSDERSFEYPLGDTGIWHGEFTLRLAQVMASAPEATWAQVLASATDAMVKGPARQIPEGEGPLLSATVFGEGSGGTRLRLEGGRIAGGLLQGLTEGALVAFHAEGAGGAALGEGRVGKVDARGAALQDPAPEGAAWIEVIAPPPPKPLNLAPAVRSDAADGQDYAVWEAVLPAMIAGRPADLVPVLVDGGLALAGPDGVLDPEGPGSSPRVRKEPGETEADALARVLEAAARGMRLREVLSSAAGRSLTGKPVIEVVIERREGAVEGAGCARDAGPPIPHDPATGVAGCDQLWLVLTNRSAKPQDISVLYQTRALEVQPIWPRQSIANRLAPGESARVGMLIDPGSAVGTEEIWILAVPMGDGRPARVDLTRLADGAAALRDLSADPADMLGWLAAQSSEEEEVLLRGFSLKPAELTMIRQPVRLMTPN